MCVRFFWVRYVYFGARRVTEMPVPKRGATPTPAHRTPRACTGGICTWVYVPLHRTRGAYRTSLHRRRIHCSPQTPRDFSVGFALETAVGPFMPRAVATRSNSVSHAALIFKSSLFCLRYQVPGIRYVLVCTFCFVFFILRYYSTPELLDGACPVTTFCVVAMSP